MLQTTQWAPDTCQCRVSYSWDDADPDDQRVYSLVAIDTRCSRHASMLIGDTHFAQIMEENARKNKALGRLEATQPQLFAVAGDGSFLGQWRFDAGHTLRFTLPGIGTTGKNQFLNWCNSNLGIGTVAID